MFCRREGMFRYAVIVKDALIKREDLSTVESAVIWNEMNLENLCHIPFFD